MKLIKIPFSGGGLGKADGSESGPDEVVNQVKDVFCNEDGKNPDFEIEEVKVNPLNIIETNDSIFNKIKQVKEHCIILGGDHSITYSCLMAFRETHDENIGLIMFDAHPDCENDFAPPTQEDVVNGLVNQGIVKPENIILAGIRNCDKKEIEFLKKHKIKAFTMKNIFEMGVKDVCDAIMEQARVFSSLYISIDIDCVDSAFAPGTGYPEPAGFSSRELLYLIQRLKLLKNLKMADIVEINPKKDINRITSKLGAKIVKELS